MMVYSPWWSKNSSYRSRPSTERTAVRIIDSFAG